MMALWQIISLDPRDSSPTSGSIINLMDGLNNFALFLPVLHGAELPDKALY